MSILKDIFKHNMECTIKPISCGNIYGVEVRVKKDDRTTKYTIPYQEFEYYLKYDFDDPLMAVLKHCVEKIKEDAANEYYVDIKKTKIEGKSDE